jgi:hypothetical protein
LSEVYNNEGIFSVHFGGNEYQRISNAMPIATKDTRARIWFSKGSPERLQYKVLGNVAPQHPEYCVSEQERLFDVHRP